MEEMEEKEQEQGKEEKASEQQEEVAQWYGGGGEAQGVYEEMRAEVGAEREEGEREERVEREREEQERETEERNREEAAATWAWRQESMRRVREEGERLIALPKGCDETIMHLNLETNHQGQRRIDKHGGWERGK